MSYKLFEDQSETVEQLLIDLNNTGIPAVLLKALLDAFSLKAEEQVLVSGIGK